MRRRGCICVFTHRVAILLALGVPRSHSRSFPCHVPVCHCGEQDDDEEEETSPGPLQDRQADPRTPATHLGAGASSGVCSGKAGGSGAVAGGSAKGSKVDTPEARTEVRVGMSINRCARVLKILVACMVACMVVVVVCVCECVCGGGGGWSSCTAPHDSHHNVVMRLLPSACRWCCCWPR